MPDPSDISRTDEISLLRNALGELLESATALIDNWVGSDPAVRGRRWDDLNHAHMEARRVYYAIQDPHPELCARTWFDVLDNVWTRCGREPRHTGPCLAPWMMEKKRTPTQPKEATND